MRNWTVWACALVILGSATSLSMAQGTKPAPAAKKPSGPKQSGLLGYSVTVSASATDNRDSTAVAEESNTDIKVSPRADGRIERPGTLLEFYYSPTYRYRSDPAPLANENMLFHDVGVNLDHEFSERFRIELREFYNLTEDPAIITGSGSLREDGEYFVNRVQGLASYMMTKTTYLDLRASHRIKEYENTEAADNLDEEAVNAGATIWHQLIENVAILAEIDVGTYELESTVADRDFDRVQAAVGVHRVLGNGMRATLRVGVTEIDHDDASLGSESAPYVQASLASDDRSKTRVRLGAGVELRDSDLSPFASQEHTHVMAAVEHKISEKIKLLGGIQYRVSDYDDVPAGAASTVTSGDEDLVAVRGGVEYRIDKRQRILAEASHHDLSSDVLVGSDRDYDRTTGTVSWQIKL